MKASLSDAYGIILDSSPNKLMKVQFKVIENLVDGSNVSMMMFSSRVYNPDIMFRTIYDH